MRKFSLPFSLFFSIILLIVLSACGSSTPQSTTTPTPTGTAEPSPTPTPMPIGSPENPFTLGVVSETLDNQVITRSQELVESLSSTTGYAFQSKVLDNFTDLLTQMEAGQIHAAWLPPITYLWAHQRGFAQVGLLSNHFGAYYYGSQFLVNVSSGFSLFYDPIADRNTAVADTALLQFADKRPCFVEPTSASGYILPKSILMENAIETQDPVWIQTHTGVVRALYIRDICDFGVTFAISGDPRTATSIQQDLPDTMNRIVVAWKSDAVIPSLNISFLPELSSDLVYDVMDALIPMAATPDGKLLLTEATGYDIQGLMKIEDSDYDPLRQTLETTQLDLASLVGR
jgi:phosphonate transport system substrate-binding protein